MLSLIKSLQFLLYNEAHLRCVMIYCMLVISYTLLTFGMPNVTNGSHVKNAIFFHDRIPFVCVCVGGGQGEGEGEGVHCMSHL